MSRYLEIGRFRADGRLFVHRVRDADPNIRTDCLKELGVWVRKYPDLYTGNSFLQYLSRGTNDPVCHPLFSFSEALMIRIPMLDWKLSRHSQPYFPKTHSSPMLGPTLCESLPASSRFPSEMSMSMSESTPSKHLHY